jgi:hypothetical protein
MHGTSDALPGSAAEQAADAATDRTKLAVLCLSFGLALFLKPLRAAAAHKHNPHAGHHRYHAMKRAVFACLLVAALAGVLRSTNSQ